MTQRGTCVGILLAAGYSRRFGTNKLLHPLADGRALALVSALNLRAAIPQVLAVVQQDNLALQQLLDAHDIPWLGVASQGMGESLAAAVRATPDAAGWVVTLADMPFIQPATIAAVSAALCDGAALVAPSYGGQRGHPVGFSAEFFPALSQLSGDEGARDVLREHQSRLQLMDCNDKGVVLDVDTPADLGQES